MLTVQLALSLSSDLSWTAGANAASHDVYLGTNYNTVLNADNSSPEYNGNQTLTTFDPGSLSQNTTYYWRIDEVNSYGTTPGVVWSFTTTDSAQPIGLDFVGSGISGSEGNTLSFSHTIGNGSDRILVVGMGSEDNAVADLDITSVTYGGTTMNPDCWIQCNSWHQFFTEDRSLLSAGE